MYSTVVDALRAERKRHGLTQAELAAQAGLSRPTIAGLEAGVGRPQSLMKVLDVLGLRLKARGLPLPNAPLGRRFAAARERRGWTAAYAAERAHLTAPTVRSIERTGNGRLESLLALSNVLGGTLHAVHGTAAGKAFTGSGGAAFSSASDEHWTPREVIEIILWALRIQEFDLDPCSPGASLSKVIAKHHLTLADDGLMSEWCGDVFVNPPFSNIGAFVSRCCTAAKAGARVVALLPVRTDTRYWGDIAGSTADVVFLNGRVRYDTPAGPGSSGAPFPSAIVLWPGWPPDSTQRLLQAFKGAWWAKTAVHAAELAPLRTASNLSK